MALAVESLPVWGERERESNSTVGHKARYDKSLVINKSHRLPPLCFMDTILSIEREKERERETKKKLGAESDDGCDLGKGSVNYSYRLFEVNARSLYK